MSERMCSLKNDASSTLASLANSFNSRSFGYLSFRRGKSLRLRAHLRFATSSNDIATAADRPRKKVGAGKPDGGGDGPATGGHPAPRQGQSILDLCQIAQNSL